MGSLRKKSYTKAFPSGAEVIQRKGETLARWKDGKGKTRTASVTTGQDGSPRIVVQSGKWLAKYRDGSGIVREVSTGCKDKGAAQSVLTELERRAELVRAGVMTTAEDSASDCQSTPIEGHLDAYIQSLKAAGRSNRHITETKRQATQIASDCGFRSLGNIEAVRVEAWLADKFDANMSARTRNGYLQALNGFCQWCVRNQRLTANPVRNVEKADEK